MDFLLITVNGSTCFQKESPKPLSDCKVFPIEGETLTAFENLKKELGEVVLQNIDNKDRPICQFVSRV